MASAPVTHEIGFAQPARLVRYLALACHPEPTVGVTGFAVMLGVLAGGGPSTVVILGAAVFCGQLTIGWSNDRIDAVRDKHVCRQNKPLATGQLSTRIVETAIGVALVATIALSLLLGVRAGLLHLAAVACGWIYNAGAKSTILSWLPYAIAFGALPGVATFAMDPPRAPSLWIIGAGATLGVVAHLTNVLPDLAEDRDTGVRGLPHRLGARVSLVTSSFLLIVATVLVVFGPAGAVPTWRYAALGVAVVLSLAGGGWALRHPATRATFYGLFIVVALELVLVATSADHLR
jgi:4-hydroxybenzoate polyprenyltransferase